MSEPRRPRFLGVISAELPRDVYVLQAGIVLNAFGNGAAGPFLVLYLHDVRGVPLAVAGLVSATSASFALLGSLASGSLADRIGPRKTLLIGLAVSTAGYLLLPLVRAGWQAALVAVLLGSGIGTWLTGQSSTLAVITPAHLRPVAFAQQRVAANLGLGLGALVGGTLVTIDDPDSFTRLFALNAVTFVAYGCVVTLVRDARRGASDGARSGTYRDVLRDTVFVRFVGLNLVFVAGAIALQNGLLPVYARDQAHVGEQTIGLLFLVNSLLIIGLQVRIARGQRGRSRMRALALMGWLFACGWLLVLTSGATADAHSATVVLLAAMSVISVAECIYDSVQGPLTADLADSALIGRYMALSGFSWQLGFIVGPALGAALLGAAPAALWITAAAACIAGSAAALRLERRLPEQARLTPSLKETAPTEAEPADAAG